MKLLIVFNFAIILQGEKVKHTQIAHSWRTSGGPPAESAVSAGGPPVDSASGEPVECCRISAGAFSAGCLPVDHRRESAGGFSSERTFFWVGPPADPLRFHRRNLALSLVRSLGVIVPGFHQRCTGRMLSDFCLWIFRWLTAGVSSHRCSPPSDLMHFFGTAIWELRSHSTHLNHCK